MGNVVFGTFPVKEKRTIEETKTFTDANLFINLNNNYVT